MAVVLLAGIPGTGKSTFCERLQNDAGWIHLDIDWLGKSKSWPSEGLRKSWERAIANNKPAIFAKACEESGNVIIDWGFPIHCITFVKVLSQSGIKVVWFDGDPKAAEEVFMERGTVSLAAFRKQMRDLASVDVPSLVGATVVRVLERGPKFKPYEEVRKELMRLVDKR